jgi:hypothetical protein
MFANVGCGLVAVLLFPSASRAQASWKLYDLRDLVSALPAAHEESTGTTSGSEQRFRFGPGLDLRKTPEIVPTKAGARNVDDLMNRICDSIELDCTRLVAGVYGIEAEEPDHARVQQMLEGIRNLYRERYAVEIVLFRVPVDQPPAVGTETTGVAPDVRQHLVVSRRTPTRVAILSYNSFLSGLSPVVATGAVGYAPETSTVDDGLDVSVVVGTNGQEADGTTLEVTGEVRTVTWPHEGTELWTADGAHTSLRFPVISVRSVQFHVHVLFDKLTVLGVLAGFEEGQSLVLAASVRRR